MYNPLGGRSCICHLPQKAMRSRIQKKVDFTSRYDRLFFIPGSSMDSVCDNTGRERLGGARGRKGGIGTLLHFEVYEPHSLET